MREIGKIRIVSVIRETNMRPHPLGVLISVLFLLGARASAQEDQSSRIKEVERKISVLSEEIERLKLGEAAPPEASGEKAGQAPAASKVYRTREKSFSLGGYGEMTMEDYAKRKQNADTAAKPDVSDFLRAVLYVGYKFNDWILFNSELEFEHGSTGKGRGEISIEQAFLDFKLYEEYLGIRGGLLLVPMGIINEIHEPTTFHGVLRPAVERNILPSTWRENGAGFFGAWGPLSYKSYVLAGLQAVTKDGVGGFRGSDGVRNGRSSGAKSLSEDAAWVGRLDITPVPGVSAGASVYTGEADHNMTAAAIPVTLWEFHAQAEWKGFEARGLYAQGRIGNTDVLNKAQGLGPASTTSSGRRLFGGYGELAFNVFSLCPRPTTHRLSPYFRYERYDTQSQVPNGFLNDAANSRVEYVLGLTYKPITQVSVKLDHQWNQNQARTGINQFNLGLAYIF